TPEHLRYRYWLHFAEGSAMPPLLFKLVFDEVQKAPMPFFIKPIAKAISQKVMGVMVWPNLKRQFDFIEAELGRSTWLAGDALTGADIMMSFPLEAAKQRAGLDASHPKMLEFIQRVHARPAYKRALKKGGPYDFA
ncbi:MAG: glutathione S-transferase family protein, partial [Burkholderiaceae bacterium]|nr:glutathione S-transferase family protein [Burkholderiaceae bacterium]